MAGPRHTTSIQGMFIHSATFEINCQSWMMKYSKALGLWSPQYCTKKHFRKFTKDIWVSRSVADTLEKLFTGREWMQRSATWLECVLIFEVSTQPTKRIIATTWDSRYSLLMSWRRHQNHQPKRLLDSPLDYYSGYPEVVTLTVP